MRGWEYIWGCDLIEEDRFVKEGNFDNWWVAHLGVCVQQSEGQYLIG